MAVKNSAEKEKIKSLKELISLGTGRGFLTFKEINDGLITEVDKEELDAILHLIEQNSIEIVESEKKYQKTKTKEGPDEISWTSLT